MSHVRSDYRIEVTQLHDGAAVRFGRDSVLIASLKARFAKARWGAGTASWHIPGKLAWHRATLWAAEQEPYLRGIEDRAREAEWEGRPVPQMPRTAPRAPRPPASPARPKPRHPMTINQLTAILHYMQRLGITRIDHPEAPSRHPQFWGWDGVSYQEAQRWLDWLNQRP